MAGDGGLNALSLLPENVLPQWQQKIANAENNEGRQSDQALDPIIFCTKCSFLQVLDLHIFRQQQPGHWGRGCLPFSPNFECSCCVILVKMAAAQASIAVPAAGKCAALMAAENC